MYDAATLLRDTTLAPNDANDAIGFGRSLALHGHAALIGAPLGRVDGTLRGTAYLFDVGAGVEVERFEACNGGPFHEFGLAVALHDGDGSIGAPFFSTSTESEVGVVYRIEASICDGDANGDGAVDFDDLNLVLSNWECGL